MAPMTAQEWDTSVHPLAMLDALFPARGMDSTESQPRKSRFYLIGCARKSWKQLPNICQVFTNLAEQLFSLKIVDKSLADNLYLLAEPLIHCRGEADDVNAIGRTLVDLGYANAVEVWAPQDMEPDLWLGFAYLAFAPFSVVVPNFHRIPRKLHSATLLREVFGKPLTFTPRLKPIWRTENVVQIANQIHSTADFSAMPVLADALEEADCDRDDILDHLRNSEHIRGCWVLDEILQPR